MNFVTAIKYAFSFLVLILISFESNNFNYLLYGAIELALIISISDFLVGKSRWFNIVNFILMLFFNAQTIMLHFANSYISLVMLENLDSAEDLQGKTVVYAIGIILVVLFSFIPIKSFGNHHLKVDLVFPALLLLELCFIFATEGIYSPAKGAKQLYDQWQDMKYIEEMKSQLIAEIANGSEMSVSGNITGYYRPQVSSNAVSSNLATSNSTSSNMAVSANEVEEEVYIPVEERLDELFPIGTESAKISAASGSNVIIVFVEGLSKNIITDSRNIMPALNSWQYSTINFTNYYNHTFATYRGLQGQLYSGYQQNNLDTNSLPSLMSVLKNIGYYTSFINTEPLNPDFSYYLSCMGFDNLIEDTSALYGPADSLSDKQAYEKLFDAACTLNESGVPFFLSMYSFGTHASLDTVDEVYGDGTDPALNKFYNADCQIATFLQKFLASSLAENTMLVITADHATYGDEDFRNAFPNYYRAMVELDEIPLMIYYKGNVATVNADGRNSLDLAPTILDMLGIDRPTSFLGSSLFSAKYAESILDTFFWESGLVYFTGNDSIQVPAADVKTYILNQIIYYFAIK